MTDLHMLNIKPSVKSNQIKGFFSDNMELKAETRLPLPVSRLGTWCDGRRRDLGHFAAQSFTEIGFTCSPLISSLIPGAARPSSPSLSFLPSLPIFQSPRIDPGRSRGQCPSIMLCQHFPVPSRIVLTTSLDRPASSVMLLPRTF